MSTTTRNTASLRATPALDVTPTGHLPYIVEQAGTTAARARLAELVATEPPAGQTLLHRAAAAYVAGKIYDEALTTSNPAETLDDIADNLPEVMPEVFKTMSVAEGLAEALLPEVANRIWTFSTIAHARADVGDDYGYVFDLLADNVRHGRDPQAVRDEVPRVVQKLRASRTLGRIWEARDNADGPWAEILDIVLGEIEKGADPQAAIDWAVGIMRQSIAERAEA